MANTFLNLYNNSQLLQIDQHFIEAKMDRDNTLSLDHFIIKILN